MTRNRPADTPALSCRDFVRTAGGSGFAAAVLRVAAQTLEALRRLVQGERRRLME